ncbi:hypothetical protein LINPERPRIM_LOCUS29641 [Linum perenne]
MQHRCRICYLCKHIRVKIRGGRSHGANFFAPFFLLQGLSLPPPVTLVSDEISILSYFNFRSIHVVRSRCKSQKAGIR